MFLHTTVQYLQRPKNAREACVCVYVPGENPVKEGVCVCVCSTVQHTYCMYVSWLGTVKY
jgi:hypothetical protein